eukprot:scpid93046/ scgid16675/ 
MWRFMRTWTYRRWNWRQKRNYRNRYNWFVRTTNRWRGWFYRFKRTVVAKSGRTKVGKPRPMKVSKKMKKAAKKPKKEKAHAIVDHHFDWKKLGYKQISALTWVPTIQCKAHKHVTKTRTMNERRCMY